MKRLSTYFYVALTTGDKEAEDEWQLHYIEAKHTIHSFFWETLMQQFVYNKASKIIS